MRGKLHDPGSCLAGGLGGPGGGLPLLQVVDNRTEQAELARQVGEVSDSPNKPPHIDIILPGPRSCIQCAERTEKFVIYVQHLGRKAARIALSVSGRFSWCSAWVVFCGRLGDYS